MKKFFTVIFALYISPSIFSQNLEIDSLVHLIEAKEHEIELLKDQIIEIVQKEGYLTQAHPTFDWKDSAELKDNERYNAKVIDTIPKGSEIILLEKEITYYKIRYKEKVGYVSTFDIKIEDTPVEYLPYARNYSNYKSNRSNKSSLDYSKPIHVKGHYRTTKSGKRVYVRPHTRSR